ncbi:TPA: hypothetical protein LUJ82_000825 [Acinetobacter baumannii]|uniref:hypothetical protein n=1 Tax=Acinetobacter TaxID=469 RepID=UPI0002CE3970|nr:hypothetical protein [Acinetobacter baumannii]EKT7934334.1 hypothetical protein [Acinetobacter baumannii]EKT8682836.1 hypothetical protein [Acinetobacter baumannii]EKV3839879.1 hypothetical protein [Acinetobacter baumannii]EKW4295290.1 hypothetical protein [Acinetobacter baumannii]EKW4442622.1 hypothetical protein [Acinetobacter baumannii]
MAKPRKKYNPMKLVPKKIHKFQMHWEVEEARRIIEIHHLLGGVDPQESTHTPLEIWMNAHHGDLALALKTRAIESEQSFHIFSRVHAVEETTGETVDCEIELATPDRMEFWQFLGDEEAELYVQDGPFKKKWLGFNGELEKYLNSVGEGKTFVVKTNHCVLTCFSAFKSFADEQKFKSKKLSLGIGVGVDG